MLEELLSGPSFMLSSKKTEEELLEIKAKNDGFVTLNAEVRQNFVANHGS